MKNKNGIDTLATALSFIGFAITGVSLLVGAKQAKVHRQQDIDTVTNNVLKQLEKKK